VAYSRAAHACWTIDPRYPLQTLCFGGHPGRRKVASTYSIEIAAERRLREIKTAQLLVRTRIALVSRLRSSRDAASRTSSSGRNLEQRLVRVLVEREHTTPCRHGQHFLDGVTIENLCRQQTTNRCSRSRSSIGRDYGRRVTRAEPMSSKAVEGLIHKMLIIFYLCFAPTRSEDELVSSTMCSMWMIWDERARPPLVLSRVVLRFQVATRPRLTLNRRSLSLSCANRREDRSFSDIHSNLELRAVVMICAALAFLGRFVLATSSVTRRVQKSAWTVRS